MSADIYLSATDCCSSHDHNITHNVGPMLRAAGLDWHDYRGESLTARHLAIEATGALERLVREPDEFRPMGAPNGWGTYDQVLPFLARLILDCIKHPDAIVSVSL